jgi:hypothetical protein
MLEAIRKRVSDLVADGELLLGALGEMRRFPYEYHSDERATIARDSIKHYNAWYVAANPLVKHNLPEMILGFEISYIEASNEAKKITGTYWRDHLEGFERTAATQLGILRGVVGGLESRALALRGLVAREIHESEMAVARELLRHQYLREAGVVAGVVLEGHLRHLCEKGGKPTGPKDTIKALNDRLRKDYPDPYQASKIDWMGDIRNLCAHKGQKDPDATQVEHMMNALQEFMAAMP